MTTETIPVALILHTELEDGIRCLSMLETPPMVLAAPYGPEEHRVLRENGYRKLRSGGEETFDDVYVRSLWRWLLYRPGAIIGGAVWPTLHFLYKRPIVGVRKGTRAGTVIRFRDLRPFPFGHRVR